MNLTKIKYEEQVVAFIRSLPPDPRRALIRSLRGLENEKGDIRPLEGALEGFYRLRVQRYRVIFFYPKTGGQRTICCVFAASRNIVYEVFTEHIREFLT